MTQEQPARLGKYEILSVLGKGGMGVVYRARDPVLDRVVAIKTLVEGSEGLGPNQVQRLLTEARSAGRLHHPNIITVFDFGEENGTSYIVLEFAEGLDLGQVIANRESLSLPEKLDILLQISRGLGYAHDCGVTHRDMKPQNVRLMPTGVAKILDFGLARYDNTHLTKSGFISGTIAYMSPERLSGQAGTSDDVFALGAVAYELLTYQRAFTGNEAPQIMMKIVNETPAAPSTIAELPPLLDAIILKCLAREIPDRYASAHDFGVAIEEAFESAELGTFVTSSARTPEFREAMTRWNTPRRRRETRAAPRPAVQQGAANTTVILANTDVHPQATVAGRTAPEAPTVALATEVQAPPRNRSKLTYVAVAAFVLFAVTGGAWMWMRPRVIAVSQKPAPPPTTPPVVVVVRPAPPVTAPTTTEDPARVQRAQSEIQHLADRVRSKLETARSQGILVSQSRSNELLQRVTGLQHHADAGDEAAVDAETRKILAETDEVIRATPRTKPTLPQPQPPAIVTATQPRAVVPAPAPAPVPAPVSVPYPAPVSNPRVQPSPQPPAAPQPAAPAPDPKAEIKALVGRIAEAYQSRDTEFFRQYYLPYSDAMANAVRNSPSQRVSFEVETISVIDATHARVAVQRTDAFGREAPPARQRLIVELERQEGVWKISRFSRP